MTDPKLAQLITPIGDHIQDVNAFHIFINSEIDKELFCGQFSYT